MPSLRLFNYNKTSKCKSIAISLRTNLILSYLLWPLKRASSFISRRILIGKRKGSMTLEAAFALPFFLFFFLQIMSAINMIGISSRVSAALHQTGNQMAFAGYAYEKTVGSALPDGLSSVAMTEGYAKGKILAYIGQKALNESFIKDGAAGLHFTGTSIMNGNDMIEIQVSYQVKPIFPILGFDSFGMNQCYYGRAWTGYRVEDRVTDWETVDPMVYITETGTVYHTDRNCTYLNPSISAVNTGNIDGQRNLWGRAYTPCAICGGKKGQNSVFITNQGNSYHSSITCSGLKRTIYTIPLSQTNGRGRCSKCG